LAAAAFPTMITLYWPGPTALSPAIVGGLFSVFLAARAIISWVSGPVVGMSTAVKAFREDEYRLESPLPKKGCKEAADLASSLNRLMLELSAYRAFHLNQVLEERAKAQALIETISDAVLLVDDRGRLIHSNKRALKILKIPSNVQDIVLPSSVGEEAFRQAMKVLLESADSHAKADVSVTCMEQDHQVGRDYRIMSAQFLLATFNRPGRAVVIRDVTVEKEIESARETFFYMITHDMRAPLASIQGYAELMGKDLHQSGKAGKYLHAIRNSSHRLNGMIEDILNTIKLERGEMSLLPEEMSSAALCKRVFELYEPLAARKGISFSMRLPEGALMLHGDPALLERVVSNLVGNSMKFTPVDGNVVLSCGARNSSVMFSVSDTGPGIPADKHGEIFEKYSQLEEHKYMGFGLGLAMCKMAVELHGGRIWVESQEGKGSNFCFTVPIGGGKNV
jgi:signal transduction histidine kinase